MKEASGKAVWRALSLLGTLAIGACSGNVVVVSSYDAAIDDGLQEFKEKLNLLVMSAASKSGEEGSFDAFKKEYLELEVKLLMLRQRAMVLEASDTHCDVSAKLKGLVAKLPQGSSVLQALSTATPPPVDPQVTVPISPLAIGKQASLPPAVGCMTHLIDNVAAQLTSIEGLHADPRHCAADGAPTLTCLRPATAWGALGPANDSLDAALLVELYKKEGEASP